MTLEYEQEIAANLERAEQSIRAARELAAGGYYDFVASRAYYAAFYAATTLLLGEQLEISKHSGVIAAAECLPPYTRGSSNPADWRRGMAGI